MFPKFSRVFNFMNFQLFVKLFQQKFLTRKVQFSRARASMDNIPGLCCQSARDTFEVGNALLTAAS